MRLLSFNVNGVHHSPGRLEAIAVAIARDLEFPDIILCQEMLWRGQTEFLRDLGYRMRYPGVRRWPSPPLIRGGLCAFMSEQWKLIGHQFVPFLKQGPVLHPWGLSDRFLQKGYQFLVIEWRGVRCTIFNTHLFGRYGVFPESEKRTIAAQRAQLTEFLEKVPGPLIVCGDFNTLPAEFEADSFYRTQLMEVFALRDEPATVSVEHNTLRKTPRARLVGNGAGQQENRRPDYLFFRDTDCRNGQLVFDGLVSTPKYHGSFSDHHGILAEFTL